MQEVRQNYHEECEAGVNQQISWEFHAQNVYLSMASYFVSLPNFAKFFHYQARNELKHAEMLMKFQNDRGGRVVLQDVRKPAKDDWSDGLHAMTSALELEKIVNQSLLNLYDIAVKHGDNNLARFLQAQFLKEQIESIKELSDYVTMLKRVGPGQGEYMFDRETLGRLQFPPLL